MLNDEIKSWELIGTPSLMQRFVVRNGRPFTPTKRIGRKRRAKMCFSNSTDFVIGKRQGTYVEGYALCKAMPFMPIHHAWVTMDGTDAMDLTLDAEGYEYFGVVFERDVLRRELLKLRHYGLLDTGFGINHELMFRIDPELEEICNAIKEKDRERRKESA
jgi:hypothetical protein